MGARSFGSPVGWPADLPAPGTAEFDARVVGWLLDRAPGELRASGLRRSPQALAAYLVHHVAGTLSAARDAYARARTELSMLSADELDRVLRAIEAEGARLLQVQREVHLVADAVLRAAAGSDPYHGTP